MKINATNQLNAGEILFNEGESTGCLYMILKGKVRLSNRGFAINAGAGMLLGIDQMGGEPALYSCRTVEETMVYVLKADSPQALNNLLNANKDYSGISVFSHARFITELAKQYNSLKACAAQLYTELKEGYAKYLELVKVSGCRAEPVSAIAGTGVYEGENEPDIYRINIYSEYTKIPYEAVKNFFGPSITLTTATLSEMMFVEESLTEGCAALSDYVADAFMTKVANTDNSLFKSAAGLGIDMKAAHMDTAAIDLIIAGCVKSLATVKALLSDNPSRFWGIDEAAILDINKCYTEGRDFRSGADNEEKGMDGDIALLLNSLENSYEQITGFASYPEEKAAVLKELLDEFAAMPDKNNTEDESRKLRKSIAEQFYNLYLAVFRASVKEKKLPKAVELFINFGYISEKLLSGDQLAELLTVKAASGGEPCVVYTMHDWLKAVYSGEKEPSRNDLGQDYAEVLRERKKTGDISEEEERLLLEDGDRKVEYEIKNVMLHANRVVNGQLSTFVPFLYSDVFVGDIARNYNSFMKVNEAVAKILQIDFTIFHRETLFTRPEAGIERDFEMKQVFPVFVAYPTSGQNAIMWQEITGRKRDSEGRILVPAFSYNQLIDMLIKAFGQYRWALCKTIQGTNWNNIQIHSLTSEYSDYIQFYKKNHELSDERKEKLKLQIQRGRNNLREIFTFDYEVWIKSEANGAIKLNKVVREILATYCPFTSEIIARLEKQPVFEQAFGRYNRERTKKAHDIELRYRSYEAKGIVVPEELKETLRLYKEM